MTEWTATLDDAAFDRGWEFGIDAIRRILLHTLDAELSRLRNWLTGPGDFEQAPESTEQAPESTTLSEVTAA